jgi:hypothetical protein
MIWLTTGWPPRSGAMPLARPGPALRSGMCDRSDTTSRPAIVDQASDRQVQRRGHPRAACTETVDIGERAAGRKLSMRQRSPSPFFATVLLFERRSTANDRPTSTCLLVKCPSASAGYNSAGKPLFSQARGETAVKEFWKAVVQNGIGNLLAALVLLLLPRHQTPPIRLRIIHSPSTTRSE